jgi:glutamate transport system permease protein
MSSRGATVLYDAPGPRARRRNVLIAVVFSVLVVAALSWIIIRLNNQYELAGSKWRPFLNGPLWTNILLPALIQTLKAAALSLVIALPIGALLGLGRLSAIRLIRWPCAAIVEFFRAIPVLLLMVFAGIVYFEAEIGSAETRPLMAVVTGLVLYNGSVLAEVFRAGVLALPKGQTEASMAIGLRRTQTLWLILLPQALTAMLPAVVSQLVVIVKDTALGSQLTVGYAELLRSTRNVTALYGNPVATYIVVAAIFIVINVLLTSLAGRLERRLRQRRGGKPDAMVQLVETGVVPAGGATMALIKDSEQNTRGR